MKKSVLRSLISVAFLVLSLPANAEPISVLGVNFEMPADGDGALDADYEGSIGVMGFNLDYQKNVNSFWMIKYTPKAISIDKDNDASEVEREYVEARSSDILSSSMTGLTVGGGWTFNLKSFDNVIFYGGGSVMLGSDYYKLKVLDSDRLVEVSELRGGAVAGMLFNYKGLFFTVDAHTITKSASLTLGYKF